MKRLFVAVPIIETVRKLVAGGILADERFRKMPVRWTSVQNLHLTLQFLGNVEEKRIPDLKKLMDELEISSGSRDLEFTSVGAFPNKTAPNILWLGIRDNTALKQVQRLLTNELLKYHFEVDKKPYRPHLTLGRVKNEQLLSADSMKFLCAAFDQAEIGNSPLDRITLFESLLRPAGPIYSSVYEKRFFLDTAENGASK